MKISVLSLLSVLILAALAVGQGSKQVPKGIREADKAEVQFEKSVPPPRGLPVRSTPQQLQREADELAKLAQSVPPEVEQVGRGILPKDLSERLKKIEKLSKRLRSELAQ